MRKWLCLGILLGLTPFLIAAGLKQQEPIPVTRDEGDSPIPFVAACNNTSWTLIASSDTIRRAIIMNTPVDNPVTSTDAICVATNTSGACTDNIGGVELTANSSFSDYSKIAWYCRARASGTGVVKGLIYRDKRDYGNIQNQALQ